MILFHGSNSADDKVRFMKDFVTTEVVSTIKDEKKYGRLVQMEI